MEIFLKIRNENKLKHGGTFFIYIYKRIKQDRNLAKGEESKYNIHNMGGVSLRTVHIKTCFQI